MNRINIKLFLYLMLGVMFNSCEQESVEEPVRGVLEIDRFYTPLTPFFSIVNSDGVDLFNSDNYALDDLSIFFETDIGEVNEMIRFINLELRSDNVFGFHFLPAALPSGTIYYPQDASEITYYLDYNNGDIDTINVINGQNIQGLKFNRSFDTSEIVDIYFNGTLQETLDLTNTEKGNLFYDNNSIPEIPLSFEDIKNPYIFRLSK